MKDSGIEWIGEIPDDWENAKIGYKADIKLGKMLQPNKVSSLDTLENYLCAINVGGNVLDVSTKKQMWFSSKEKNDYLLKKGDLLVVEGGDIGSCAIIQNEIENTYFQNALHRVRSLGDNDIRWIKYFLFYAKKSGHLDLICNKATIQHFTKEKLYGLCIPFPPPETQKSIADFLDAKCAKIDSLDSDIKKQIEILEEYKKSVITEAVTGKVEIKNGKAYKREFPQKKSASERGEQRIEWIGEIPEHWKVIRIKNNGVYWNGLTYTPQDLCDEGEGTLVLRSSNVQNGKMVFDDNVYVKCKIDEKSEIKKGDILICSRNGSKELIGKNAIYESDEKMAFGAFMMIYRCNNFHFMYYVLNSNIFFANIGLFSTSTVNQLIGSVFGNIKFPLPPIDEQKSIADYLDSKCSSIDSIIAQKQQQREKLEEYKKSLIFEYVTGKKQVEA